MAYLVEYSPAAVDHLRALPARQQATIVNAVDRQLADEPLRETWNRKPMRPNPVAPWEFRVGKFRVYYELVEERAEPFVRVLAIGIKQRNRVFIGDEEIIL